jgi:nicotinate phosphoribosyltransferase
MEEMGLALATDLYELTMAQSYWEHGMHGQAVFSLFVRTLPQGRGYLVAAGLEDVLRYLEGLRFTASDLQYLESTGIFSPPFLEYLAGLRFTGEVWAVTEGSLVFANEPILEVKAPIIEAQLAETYIINQVHLQTVIATKAARCVWAAKGRVLVDFAFRRTHGLEAGLKVARCCYLVGFAATSNVLAGKVYGIPVAGTMAHSYVMAFPSELEAFQAFARSFPERSVLLIDTYDTLQGARIAALVGQEMAQRGHRLRGVRLDSGDLLSLSREVRKILDAAGLTEAQIFASGGLDEWEIEALVRGGAPIDAFGVGTRMGVSADAPWLDMAYKLVEYEGRPVLKLSQGKATLPGAKQVFRFYDGKGAMARDVLALRGEQMPGGRPLLRQVMKEGRILGPLPTLQELRRHFQEEFARLPEPYKDLHSPAKYTVEVSPGIASLQQQLAISPRGAGPSAR